MVIHPTPGPQIRRFRWRDHPKQQLFPPESGSQQEVTSRNLLLENGISQTIVPATPPHPEEICSSTPPPPLSSEDDELSQRSLMEPPLRE
ncbi:hypothetical protein CEXT_494091 [Caerostris extrusa]|uniref:Uncharacterized protein n=1 Tax=Caerostris extrusa TaxID=172846 RepID=A0AAV4VZ91_CAEEX|nr:hypothetical protein CEXT_494091 [Caerostris extrusa]